MEFVDPSEPDGQDRLWPEDPGARPAEAIGEPDRLINDVSEAGPGLDTTAVAFSDNRGMRPEVPVDGLEPEEPTVDLEREAAKDLARERVDFHFAPASHAPTNAEAVAANLTAAGCNTVAFELVTSAERRPMFETAMNVCLDKTLPDADRAAAVTVLDNWNLGNIRAVIERLGPTVDTIKTIDINAEDPGYDRLLLTDEANQAFNEVINTQQPNAIQRESLVALVGRLADEGNVREPLVAEQLVELAIDQSALGPRKVGVVIGPGHEGPYEMVSGDGFRSTLSPRLHAPEEPGPSLLPPLIHQLMQNRNEPLDPEQVDRALLEIVGRHHHLRAESYMLANRLPADQLAALMREIDSVKPGSDPSLIFIDTKDIIRRTFDEFAAAEAGEGAEIEAAKALARERVGFHFVRATHVPESAEAVAADLTTAGCTTVAFEFSGTAPEVRQQLVDAMNVYNDRSLPAAVRGRAAETLDRYSMHYEKEVIGHLRGIERIRSIDVDMYHPAFGKMILADAVSDATRRAIQSYQPNGNLRWFVQKLAEARADESIDREPVMAEQLVRMAVEEATLEPHIIGAVMGAGHDGPYEMVSADGFACTASPPLIQLDRGPRLLIPLAQQLIRDRTGTLPPEQVDRALLEMLGRDHQLGGAASLELASKLPAGQLGVLMDAIDAVKQEGRAPADMFADTAGILRRAFDEFVAGQP